jgi:hypothetical protein
MAYVVSPWWQALAWLTTIKSAHRLPRDRPCRLRIMAARSIGEVPTSWASSEDARRCAAAIGEPARAWQQGRHRRGFRLRHCLSMDIYLASHSSTSSPIYVLLHLVRSIICVCIGVSIRLGLYITCTSNIYLPPCTSIYTLTRVQAIQHKN